MPRKILTKQIMNNTDIALLLRKTTRRQVLRNLGLGAVGLAAFGARPAHGQIAINSIETTSPYPIESIPAGDLKILDFALNLEYLEANFYSYATTGVGIESQGVEITGRGTQGTVNVPTTSMVTFSDPSVQQYAAEITADEIAHVKFLRGLVLAAGHIPIAQPAIDLVNSFNTAASAAGLGSSFSPFTNDLNFLLGAFIFEDVGVTAYHGALASFIGKNTMKDAAGIMGTEAYHASNVRTLLFEKGSAAQAAAQDISNARNSLGGQGLDQGVVVNGNANIVPADTNALVYARTTQEVLNIVYLSANGAPGGFFPNGINA
jgi:hypothetical protein